MNGFEDPLTTERIVRTVISLLIVCSAAALVISWWARRLEKGSGVIRGYLSQKPRMTPDPFPMRVLNRLRVARDVELVLVAIGKSEKLLFSSRANEFKLIGRVDDEGALAPDVEPEEEESLKLAAVTPLKRRE